MREIPDLVDITSWWTTTAKTKPSQWPGSSASRCLSTTAILAMAATSKPRKPGRLAPTWWSWSHPDYSTRLCSRPPWPTRRPTTCTTWCWGRGLVGGQALHGALPLYKYISTRFLPPSRTCSCA